MLRERLGIDHVIVTNDHHHMLGDEALLLLLRRMASSHQRHIDLEDEFGVSSSSTCTITLWLLWSLHVHWTPLIFCADVCFTPEHLQQYAAAVSQKCACLTGTA